jgi:hypothetical protein
MRAAVVVIAPKSDLATLSVGVARELVSKTPSIERLVAREGDTKTGFTILRPAMPGSPEREVHFMAVAASRGGVSVRGYDIIALILDESEFFTSNTEAATTDGYAISDKDIYNAARPRLRGPAIFISTPWPVDNLTAEKYEKNFGHPEDALACIGRTDFMWRGGSREAEVKQFVAEAREEDPENASRELDCIIGEGGGSLVFDKASVDRSCTDRPDKISVKRPAHVGAGVDVAFVRDATAAVVVSQRGGAYVFHEYVEIKPTKDRPLEPRNVIRNVIAPLMSEYGARGIMGDSHYRESVKEHLTAVGLRFQKAPEGTKGKYDTYSHLRNLFREGKINFPPMQSPHGTFAMKRLRQQLLSVVWKPLPGGGYKISSPRRIGEGGHGDIVSALVLACWAAKKSKKDAAVESPVPRTRPGGDYASMDAGGYDHGGWDSLPIDGGSGGTHIGSGRRVAKQRVTEQPAVTARREAAEKAVRPPKEAKTPGELALESHGWIEKHA